MKVIGLCGRKRVGKDTVARILWRGGNYERLAFADPLYEMLNVLKIDPKYKEDKLTTIPWIGKSYTELLQSLGTEWGRKHVRDEIWIRCLNEKVIAAQEAGKAGGIVITDVRNENEAVYVTNVLGGSIWEVVGPRGVVYNNHSSEQPVPRIHIKGQIENDSTLEVLESRVMALL